MRYLSPFNNRQDLLGDFDKLVDSFFSNNHKNWENFPACNPKVDIKESKDYFLISADIPGMNEDDINVEVNNGVLNLSGERNFEHKEQKSRVR